MIATLRTSAIREHIGAPLAGPTEPERRERYQLAQELAVLQRRYDRQGLWLLLALTAVALVSVSASAGWYLFITTRLLK